MNKRYIIAIKLAGDRKKYYYANSGNSIGTTQDLFLTKMFSTLSGAKSVMNVLSMNHPTLFGSEATYEIKEVKLTVL